MSSRVDANTNRGDMKYSPDVVGLLEVCQDVVFIDMVRMVLLLSILIIMRPREISV